MIPVLHMVWLGGQMPLRSQVNLARLARLYSNDLANQVLLPPEERFYFPLLWLDDQARTHLAGLTGLPAQEVGEAKPPVILCQAARAALGAFYSQCRWLQIEAWDGEIFVPFVVYEAMRAHLQVPWMDMSDVLDLLNHLRSKAPEFIQRELLAEGIEFEAQVASTLDGQTVYRFLNTLVDFARIHWGAHGLLCLASDIVRLQALIAIPGAYVDLGDVAGMIACLPTANRVRAGESPFCAHQTVAIENDLIFCSDPSLLKGIAFGVYLWSLNTLRRAALRLELNDLLNDSTDPQAQAALLLPVLDQRMPALANVRDLFQPPFVRLADYINVAYGSLPRFGCDAFLAPFLAGRQVKQLLVNNVAGFTAYQKFAHLLAPASARTWETCAPEFGLEGYAPQLGWRVQGFGLVDGLIYCGRCLDESDAERASAEREIRRLAGQLNLDPVFLGEMARYCTRAYTLLASAHFDARVRLANDAELLRLAGALDTKYSAMLCTHPNSTSHPAGMQGAIISIE